MPLGYPNQQSIMAIGTKSGTTYTGATLTAAYTNNLGRTIATGGISKVSLYCVYTMGASETTNSVEIRTEFSPDATNWFQDTNEAISAGTSTLSVREYTHVGANAAARNFVLLIDDVADPYMRLAVKETGVVTNFGTCSLEVTLSGI